MKIHFSFSTALISFYLLSANFLCTISSDLNSDTSSLLEFALSVPHARKLNWNPTTPVCSSWIGISCTKDGSRVRGVHLPALGLYGSIPENTIGKLDALRVLSLRSNYLSGNLPSDILSIPSLKYVYLQHNNFSGNIPASLLPRLSVLDLSFNSFSGRVPNLDMPTLQLLNLSYNSLNGSIPEYLQKFPVSSFIGNSHLCGSPLANCPGSSRRTVGARKLSLGSIIGLVIGAAFFIILLFLAYLLCFLKKKHSNGGTSVIKVKAFDNGKLNENLKSEDFGSGVQGSEKNRLVVFQECSFSFDLEDLLRASAEVLGKGSFGTTYKAVLDEATTVAVKRLREVGIGKKEFDQHMELVSRVGRHPNMVPLLAYYCSKDEKLLVCEYMPAGSLSAALHGNRGASRTPLDWDTRLNIALGAARGISHIHSEGGANFTHGNIKSSNILLRAGLDSCISDFGLNLLIHHHHTHVKHRAPGYDAPEVIQSLKTSQKSDVYSFGVLLLEILTGKPPVQYSGYHDNVIDLPRWVRSVVREEWTAEVFDAELVRNNDSVEEELVQMLQIALCCVGKGADVRPCMEQVVGMIERIRHPEVENRPSSEDYRSKDSDVCTP